ncbi:MAG: MFS transporter [Chloroflexota bacterium]|nr:MFS transporter [Chloroflexota bacterium]
MDKLGRRAIFLGTMVMFVESALAQAFAPNVETLAGIRLLLGIPLGADIVVGYTHVMESMPPGKREAMGIRWQAMFAAGVAPTPTVADRPGPRCPSRGRAAGTASRTA